MANIETTLDKVRAQVTQRRLRMDDFFTDFDRLHRGRITPEQFRRVLAVSRIQLTDEERLVLVDAFDAMKMEAASARPAASALRPREEVNYVAFLRSLREKDPPKELLAHKHRRPIAITGEEDARLLPTMQLIRHAVAARGIHIVPPFRDMDPLNTGKVTASQFERCIPFDTLDPVALELLVKKYGDGNGNVYYMMWCADVDPTLRELDQQHVGVTATNPAPSALFFCGSYKNPNLTSEELIRILREQFALYRLRCEDYFTDFDKFKTGTVTPAQFESALGRLNFVKFSLTKENTEALVRAYTVGHPEVGDATGFSVPRVNYRSFLYDTNPKNFPVISADGQVSSNYFISTHAPDTFLTGSGERESADRVLDRVRRLVKANRIFLSPVLRDFDRVSKMIHEHRTCTASRFGRGLATQKLILPPEELEILIKKYTIPHADGSPSFEVNYYQFVQDVDPSQAQLPQGQAVAKSGLLERAADSKGASVLRPATELDALLMKMALQAKEFELRAGEFFADFDPLRSGIVLNDKFVTALGIAGFELQGSELELLQQAYRSHKSPHYVDTIQFLRDIGAYSPGTLERTYTGKPVEPVTGVDPEAAATSAAAASAACRLPSADGMFDKLSDFEREKVAQIVKRLKHEVSTHGALLTPFFSDFDHFNRGKITRHNFLQALARHKFVLSEPESDLLCKAYSTPNDKGILDYRQFIRDIGFDECVKEEKVSQPCTSAAASAMVDVSVPAPREVVPEDLSAVLDKVCCFLQERNPRVSEFFPDGDELRHQHVTPTRFRHCVSILGIVLTESEIASLEKGFASQRVPGEMDYPGFVYTVRRMLDEGAGERAVMLRRMGKTNATIGIDATPQNQEERVFVTTMAKLRRALATRRTQSLPAFREYDRMRKGHVKEGQFFACLMTLGVQLTPLESQAIGKAYSLGNGEMGYIRFCQEVDNPELEMAALNIEECMSLVAVVWYREASPSTWMYKGMTSMHKNAFSLWQSIRPPPTSVRDGIEPLPSYSGHNRNNSVCCFFLIPPQKGNNFRERNTFFQAKKNPTFIFLYSAGTMIAAMQGTSSHNFFSRNNKRTLFMEDSLLPLLNSLLYRYPPIMTLLSVIVELVQCLAFALNPHNPGSYIAYSLLYYSHLPVFDGDFQLIGFPSYKVFTIYFSIVAVLVGLCIVVFIVSMTHTQLMIEKIIGGIGFRHVLNFMISIFFIPTIQTLLSGFICQKKPLVSAIERESSSYDSGAVFDEHIVFFKDQSCNTSMVTAIMVVSMILLLLWGTISLVMMMTLIPVDREDVSCRRRCSAYLDLILFVYKVGLCVNFHMAYAYNVRGTSTLVIALSSFIVAFAHGFVLPYYAEWMNRLSTAGFAVIGWAGFAEYMAYRIQSQNFVNKGTIFIVLCVPAVVIGVAAWFMAGIRYNPQVKKLLHGATEEFFVSVDKNPFVLAFLQNNFDLLPFPKRLPATDSLFSPYYSISVDILEEALREEDVMRHTAEAPLTEGMENRDDPDAKNVNEVASADIRVAEALGMETEWNGVNIIAEASRRQVIAPTLTTAWLPTDAEACVRFLYDWQAKTETFPSPHMICFASRIFNRFLLKWHQSSIIMITYIGFLCDFAPSFSRMSTCLELIRYVSSEFSNDITETFLLYYFSLHVKMSLGIRSSLHQDIFMRAKNLHQQTLLRTTLLWRSLQEEKRNIVTLYWFTSDLAQVRWDCYNAYRNALSNIVDDEILVKNVGMFYDVVYKFKRSGIICKMVAANLAQMQLMRLQRTFHDTALVADAEEEEEEEKKKQANEDSDGATESSRISSNLSNSLGSSNTSSRVSSISSGGRSSQARSRNAKRAAELMIEKVNEITNDLYFKLQEHLDWSILSICSVVAFFLIIVIVIMNIIVVVIKFSEWERLTDIIMGLTTSRTIMYMVSVQMFRVSEMLPEVSYLLSSSQISNIQNNITFFRSIINAAEATTSNILYGEYRPKEANTHEQFTRIRNFVRVYTAVDRYADYRVSFITHITTVLSTARRVADLLDSMPNYDTFRSSPDVTMLTENLLITLDSTFTEVESDVHDSIRDFSLMSVIIFAIIALASVVAVCVSCYILLWNYRRAASVIASELRLFFIIPRESIRRLTVDTQKDMDNFAQSAEMAHVVSRLNEERKDATHASLVQSFCTPDSHASSALLDHLLKNQRSSSPKNDNETGASSMSPKSHATDKEGAELGEMNQPGKASGHHESHGGHVITEASGEHITMQSGSPVTHGEPKKEDFADFTTKKKKHPRAFMLLNDFTYPDLLDEEASGKRDDANEDGLDELLAAGLSLKESKDMSLAEFTWLRVVLFTFFTLIFVVTGVALLIVATFSLSNLSDAVTATQKTLSCAQEIANTTGNMLYYSAWYIARGNYEDFTQAQAAILENTASLRDCRSSINRTDFFALRQEAVHNTLIALSLVAHSTINPANPEMILAYPIVLNYTWTKLQQTHTMTSYLQPYLTQEEMKEWVPYSSSDEDLKLPADEMKELGVKTFFGSFGRSMTEVVVSWNQIMVSKLIEMSEESITQSAKKFRLDLSLIMVFWSCAALVSQLHFFSSSRKKPVLVVLWSLFAILSIGVVVVAAVGFHYTNKYIVDLTLWADEVGAISSKNLKFLDTISNFLGYPLVASDVTLMNLLNVTEPEYIIHFDNAFFPQPNEVYSNVDTDPYYSMIHNRNTLYHYSWLTTVCAAYGHGSTSVFMKNPSVEYVRWDMSTDALYETYQPLYPADTYLSTFQKDVTDKQPAETLKICQGAMTNHLMTDLASNVWSSQLSAGNRLIAEYSEQGNTTNEKIQVTLYTSFGCGCAAVVCFFGVLITLTIYSVRAFSRTDEERMVHRAAFHSDGNKVIMVSALILLCMVFVNGLGIYYSINVKDSLLIGSKTMKIRWMNNCLLALGSALSSFTSYYDFLSINYYFGILLGSLDKLMRDSYLATPKAVSMSKGRFPVLFGRDTPFANFSSVSSDTLFATSCVDPTNKVSGNQQPVLIQNSVMYDIMRTINTLPASNTSMPNAFTYLLDSAFDIMGPLEYAIFNSSVSPLLTVEQERERVLIVSVVLLALAAVLAILYYFLVLHRIVVKTRQQSIGTKLLLLGLPDDILNTVPEIKEFYDPEAGSSDDQLKRKLQQSERLLQNILPPNISRRLKNGERVIADAHKSVTVVFASLVGFDEYSSQFDARGLVHFLNGIVVAFDHIVDLLDLEKVKTIADVYFFCGGLTKKTERDHPIRCFECSLFFFQALEDHNSRHSTPNIQLRVGINTDAAVAGVIGNKKVAYDLWGDCVNTASRMYSTGVAGRIQVSDNTYKRVSNYYSFEDRHVQAKGKGALLTHLYVDRIKNTAYTDLNWRSSKALLGGGTAAFQFYPFIKYWIFTSYCLSLYTCVHSIVLFVVRSLLLFYFVSRRLFGWSFFTLLVGGVGRLRPRLRISGRELGSGSESHPQKNKLNSRTHYIHIPPYILANNTAKERIPQHLLTGYHGLRIARKITGEKETCCLTDPVIRASGVLHPFSVMASDDDDAVSPGFIVRVQYAIYLFLGLLASLLLRGSLGKLFSKFPILQKGCSAAVGDACAGEMVAYRISFALAVFFFIHWLSVSDLTCCIASSSRAKMQTSFFTVKSVVLGFILAGTFFIPNTFFYLYAYVCMFASALFLLLNIIFMVDFSYFWNDDWGRRAEHNGKWMWYLLIVAAGSFLIGAGVCVASYIIFVPHGDCNFNAFAVTSILVGALLYTVLSIWLPHGSIVPSSIVFIYTSTVMFTTLRTQQQPRCNRLSGSIGDVSIKQMLLGSLVPSFTLLYAVVSAGGNATSLRFSAEDEDEDEEDPDESGHLSRYLYFHFIMILGSMYLAMLATGWHVNGGGDDVLTGSTKVAAVVRYVTVWLAIALYLWTLVAPYTCCRDRDFGFDIDDDW
eukprot:gene4814-3456_t